MLLTGVFEEIYASRSETFAQMARRAIERKQSPWPLTVVSSQSEQEVPLGSVCVTIGLNGYDALAPVGRSTVG